MSKKEKTHRGNNTDSRLLPEFNLDWLGQMIASVLWAVSIFAYGITSMGDVLQLCAAMAWMIANIASLMRGS